MNLSRFLLRFCLCVAGLSVVPALHAINATYSNYTSTIYLTVTYDKASTAVGQPVTIHVVSSTYNGGSFHFIGAYNAFQNSDFTVNPPSVWGYGIDS
ncbi:MAG TPA: hypothetical protein VHO24_11980, partial [Opitutaceae bacterium]|nr:hypothetical protein [Opitutaceae bacterium]